MDSHNKPIRRLSAMQMIKVLFAVLALIVAYLFSLNGRYVKVDDDLIMDKWKCELLIIESKQLPIKE